MITALSGTTIDRKTTSRSRNDRPSTAPMKSGRRDESTSAKSCDAAVKPADVHGHVGALGRRGDHVGAQVVDQLRRRLVLRRRGREHLDHRGVARRVRDRGAHERHSGHLRQRVVEASDVGLCARAALLVGHDEQRTVEARAEPLGEQVVGAARGVSGRLVARVGHAEAQREERRGEQDQDEQAARERGPRATLHRARPSDATATPSGRRQLRASCDAGARSGRC